VAAKNNHDARRGNRIFMYWLMRDRPSRVREFAVLPRCADQDFFSAWPPNWKRMADKIWSEVAFARDKNRS